MPALIQRLDALQMHEKSLRVKLLRGRAMKELGESAEALVWMEQVEAEAVRDGDLVLALALCDRAEILSSDGCFELAMTACRKAIEFAKRCDSGWVVANIQGSLGELLRNQGELSASVDAYSACVNSYDDLEMQICCLRKGHSRRDSPAGWLAGQGVGNVLIGASSNRAREPDAVKLSPRSASCVKRFAVSRRIPTHSVSSVSNSSACGRRGGCEALAARSRLFSAVLTARPAHHRLRQPRPRRT